MATNINMNRFCMVKTRQQGARAKSSIFVKTKNNISTKTKAKKMIYNEYKKMNESRNTNVK